VSARQYAMLPQSLQVNIPEIDVEHDELFVFLKSFKKYCFEHSLIPQEKRIALHRLLVRYFKTEERLAVLPSIDFAGHEYAHEKMLQTVSQTLGQITSNNSDLYSLIRYIGYWFESHILRYDLTLAKCLSTPETH
jgi:hemerythrin-like metal-binding protein